MPGAVAGGDVHFVQRCDGPLFAGAGSGALDCACGNRLIDGYDPAHFLAVRIRCVRCAGVTETPALADVTAPPSAVVIAEAVAQPSPVTTTLTASAVIIGRAEMDRISALYRPATTDTVYQISPALLDEAAAIYERTAGRELPVRDSGLANPYTGLKDHALAWAVGHLRAHMRQPRWHCMDDVPTPIAIVTLTGFLQFVATWSHHPYFPAMAAGAGAHGFSAHDLAPFAAAHCATMQGNRIRFAVPAGDPARITGFSMAVGPTGAVDVLIDILDRFEVPFGQSWDKASLRAAVAERIAASQARINPRNHGLLLLSPGAAMAGFDEALIEAVKDVLQTQGRKHRGLMAVAPIVLRLQQMPDPHTVRLCYGFFPAANRHYDGETALRTAS